MDLLLLVQEMLSPGRRRGSHIPEPPSYKHRPHHSSLRSLCDGSDSIKPSQMEAWTLRAHKGVKPSTSCRQLGQRYPRGGFAKLRMGF